MSKSLYVGNLPWSVTEESLRELFMTQAQVEVDSVRLVSDRETGRSRGFGFVEVADENLAACVRITPSHSDKDHPSSGGDPTKGKIGGLPNPRGLLFG